MRTLNTVEKRNKAEIMGIKSGIHHGDYNIITIYKMSIFRQIPFFIPLISLTNSISFSTVPFLKTTNINTLMETRSKKARTEGADDEITEIPKPLLAPSSDEPDDKIETLATVILAPAVLPTLKPTNLGAWPPQKLGLLPTWNGLSSLWDLTSINLETPSGASPGWVQLTCA